MPKSNAVVLTDKAVQAAKVVGGQRLELWDARVPGLCLRVTEKGAKTWVVRYRTIDGRQPRLTLGTAGRAQGDLSLIEARDRASEVRRLAREGGDPAASKREKAAEARAIAIRTVGDLAEVYFRRCENGTYRATRAGKKLQTIAGERRLWAFRLLGAIGARRLEDVSRSEVRELLTAIAEEAPIQSNRARALLRSMFNFAVREERLAVSPMTGVMAAAEEKPRDRVLTDNELRAVWCELKYPSGLKIGDGDDAKPLWVSEQVRIALQLCLLTLQRRTEIAGMRVDELRLEEGTWTLVRERTKNGKAHLVPLPPTAVALIRSALELRGPQSNSPFVFPSPWKKLRDKSIDGGALSHALSDIYAALKIEGANLHDLRRSGASVMASERLLIPPIVISRLLNHTLDGGGGAAVTARHYAIHDYAKEKRAALHSWSKLLEAVATGAVQVV